MAGKKWTPQQETELKILIEADATIQEIAAKLQKAPRAVIVKCRRLGLPLKAAGYVQSQIYLPKELPSVEETLRMLAGAMKSRRKTRAGPSRGTAPPSNRHHF
jgi:hypothetical protein